MHKTLALLLCFALSQTALSDRARSRAERLVAEGKRLEYGMPSTTQILLHPFSFADNIKFDEKAALARFNEAIKVCPTYGPAYGARAHIYLFTHQEKAARADAWKAVELGTEDFDYLILSSAFEGAERRKFLQQAIERCQDATMDSYLESRLIETYLSERDYKRYIKEMERRSKRTRDSSDYYQLGQAYELLDQPAQAEGAYRRALAARPFFSLYDTLPAGKIAEKILITRLHQNDLAGAEVVLAQMEGKLTPEQVRTYRGLLAVLAGRKVPDAAGLARLVRDDLFVEAVLQHAAGKSQLLRDYLKANSQQRWECAQARRLLKNR